MIKLLNESPVLVFLLVFAGLAASLVGMTIVGLRIGRKLQPDKESELTGLGAIEGSIFGLFGLLLAFTFSGAADRFHARKALILEEAQAAGTFANNVDLLAEPTRGEIRKLLGTYLDLNLGAFDNVENMEMFERNQAAAAKAGEAVQKATAAACSTESGKALAEVIMPPMNELLDIGLARKVAIKAHPPMLIFVLLFAFALASALVTGFAMSTSKKLSWLHVGAFGFVVAATITVTLDLELPRLGTIRVSSADAVLRDVRDSLR